MGELTNLSLTNLSIDWLGLAPILIFAVGSVLLLTVRSLLPSATGQINARFWQRSTFDGTWMFCMSAAALTAVVVQWLRVVKVDEPKPVYSFIGLVDGLPVDGLPSGQFVSDGFSLFISAVICVSVAMVSLTLPNFCARANIAGSEMYVLMMLSAVGGLVMAGAADLLVLFLGLETLSIAVYVMAAIDRRRATSVEAGIKYFILGAFSSAFLLYGIALIYGATGTTNLVDIKARLDDIRIWRDFSAVPEVNGLLLAGVALIMVGFGFKIAAVPFHTWVPDVYQASPTPVTAFMASTVKAAGFVMLVRVVVFALDTQANHWQPVIYGLAAVTLLVGAFVAVAQNDVKRMLAYSSIVHAGFMLLGVYSSSDIGFVSARNSDKGLVSVLFYIAVYSVIAVGSFTVISQLQASSKASGQTAGRPPDGSNPDDRLSLRELQGLASRHPVWAAVFTVLLLAQAGVPFTSGFMAKFNVIIATVEVKSYSLAAIAMISAVVVAFAYLRVVVAMYFTDAQQLVQQFTGFAGKDAQQLVGDVRLFDFEASSSHPQSSSDFQQGSSELLLEKHKLEKHKTVTANTDKDINSHSTISYGAIAVVCVAVIVTLVLGVYPEPLQKLAAAAVDAAASLSG